MVTPTPVGEPLSLVRMRDADGKDCVVSSILVETGATINFRISELNIRRDGSKTGYLELYVNRTQLTYSDSVRIDNADARAKLVSIGYRQMPSVLAPLYTQLMMEGDLSRFTKRAWEVWMDARRPLEVVGSPFREPIEFLLHPFLPKGGGTILFGPPGKGKSFIALLMAMSMNYGLQSLWKTEQTKVLFVNLERSDDSIQKRIGAVSTALGMDPTSSLLVLNERGKRLADVANIIDHEVNKNNVQMVILDSLSRAGTGDLTDNVAANTAMDMLNNVAPSWMSIGHTPRHDSSHIYGGIHFDAAADIMVQQMIEDKGNALGIALKITKGNDTGKPQALLIALEFDELGLIRVWKPQSHEFPQLVIATTPQPSTENEIVQYLKQHGQGSADSIMREINASSQDISQILRNQTLFKWLRTTQDGPVYALQPSYPR